MVVTRNWSAVSGPGGSYTDVVYGAVASTSRDGVVKAVAVRAGSDVAVPRGVKVVVQGYRTIDVVRALRALGTRTFKDLDAVKDVVRPCLAPDGTEYFGHCGCGRRIPDCDGSSGEFCWRPPRG